MFAIVLSVLLITGFVAALTNMYFRNTSLKVEIECLESEKLDMQQTIDQDRLELDSVMRDCKFERMLLDYSIRDLKVASQGRDDAWAMLEVVLTQGDHSALPAKNISAEVGRAGVHYLFTPKDDALSDVILEGSL